MPYPTFATLSKGLHLFYVPMCHSWMNPLSVGCSSDLESLQGDGVVVTATNANNFFFFFALLLNQAYKQTCHRPDRLILLKYTIIFLFSLSISFFLSLILAHSWLHDFWIKIKLWLKEEVLEVITSLNFFSTYTVVLEARLLNDC